MTRVPVPGQVKKRLIPGIGADGACHVHKILVQHTLKIAADLATADGMYVNVCFTGSEKFPDSLCNSAHQFHWSLQQGDSLGERLIFAINAAYSQEAESVVVIGTDCPDLTSMIINQAVKCLEKNDVVLGPALDGGYFLIGIKRSHPEIFQDIDWGTENVLKQTLNRCREHQLSYKLLSPLNDVDYPEDLITLRKHPELSHECFPKQECNLLSILIPTLNEEHQLKETIKRLRASPECEIIIADGGSSDGTIDLALQLGCRVIQVNRGRGAQLNAAAAVACGEYLLFLHADSHVPDKYDQEIIKILNNGILAGAFRFNVELAGRKYRFLEWLTNLRSTLLKLPYGDQGLFIRADDFYHSNGYKQWPIMEDFEFIRRLNQHGKISISQLPIITSGRRWQKLGLLRNTIINQLCILLYVFGISPTRIACIYRYFRY